jgi:hypothetical protein
MHRFSIAFACIAGVFASQACLADSHMPFHFTKANLNDEQFRQDRKECIAKATTVYEGSCVSQTAYAQTTPGGISQIETTGCIPTHGGIMRDSHDFLRCMLAKGYQESLPLMPAGKAGLYELRKFSNLALFTRRDLLNTLPYTQRRASADALTRPGPVFQLCVPQDGAQQLGAVAGLSSSCTYSNIVSAQHGFSADASCHGDQSIHFTFESTTPDRREFTVIGQPVPKAAVPHIDKYQINWISPDCGGIPPGTVRTPDGKPITIANPKPTK